SGCRGRKEKAPPDDGAKDVMHGATQGSLNPSPTRSHSRANTSKLGQGITLSGMARFVQIAVVPSPGPLAVRTHGGSGRLAIPARSGSLAPWAFDDPAQSDQVTTFHSIGPYWRSVTNPSAPRHTIPMKILSVAIHRRELKIR